LAIFILALAGLTESAFWALVIATGYPVVRLFVVAKGAGPKKLGLVAKRLNSQARKILRRWFRTIARNLRPPAVAYGFLVGAAFLASLQVSTLLAVLAALALTAVPLAERLVRRFFRGQKLASHLTFRELDSLRPVKPPEPTAPMATVKVSSERTLTGGMPADGPPHLAIFRILGNDLPPRHSPEQTIENLLFTLDHEEDFPNSSKYVILNRIIDGSKKDRLRSICEAHGVETFEIPFNPEDYRRQPLDLDFVADPTFFESEAFQQMDPSRQVSLLNAVYRYRNSYGTNVNGARNFAIRKGLEIADWVLPLDGNVFIPKSGWATLTTGIQTFPGAKYWVLPMRRSKANRTVIGKTPRNPAREEPQIAFSRSSSERFNELIPYGRRPKVELLWKLGAPGPWQGYSKLPWDQPFPEKSIDYGQFGIAGEVIRLSSGNWKQDVGFKPRNVASTRNMARDMARLSFVLELDLLYNSPELGLSTQAQHPSITPDLVKQSLSALGDVISQRHP
jgi:hypothetical protein